MLKLFLSGIIWHYTKAYVEIIRLFRDFIWFILHLFSVKDLSRTIFYPWQRLGEPYQGGFNISAWFSAFVVNTLMRLVGFVVKSFVILIGISLAILVGLISIVFIVFWTIVPIFLVFLFVTSIRLFVHLQ